MSDMTEFKTPGYIHSYGCTRCQQYHYSDQPLFEPHIMWQSKHGIRTAPDYVVADGREAAQHFYAKKAT